jgi:Zinc knuckle
MGDIEQNGNEATNTVGAEVDGKVTESRPGSHWRVWSCVEALVSETSSSTPSKPNRMMMEPYRSTTEQVASILELWGRQWAGNLSWGSMLNKRTLHHEAEECIVALYFLRQWMLTSTRRDTEENRFIAVDVCGGKGIFSMMLSYMASEFWQPEDAKRDEHIHPRKLEKIILLEKATHIDWMHIEEANERGLSEKKNYPAIEIWPDTNLHAYDTLIEKYQALSSAHSNIPLAMTGIHLCKMLSPSLVSLVNGLGPLLCPYLCLAPCCLPRVVINPLSTKEGGNGAEKTISINDHETNEARESRLDHNRRKNAARNRFACYLCQSKRHWVKQCPRMELMSDGERANVMEAALASIPCWICGVVGHFKNDCPTPEADRITTQLPPTVTWNVSNIITSPAPYEKYCELLATHVNIGTQPESCHNGLKNTKRVAANIQVVEAGLTDTSYHELNWNSRRKSIFIIAGR